MCFTEPAVHVRLPKSFLRTSNNVFETHVLLYLNLQNPGKVELEEKKENAIYNNVMLYKQAHKAVFLLLLSSICLTNAKFIDLSLWWNIQDVSCVIT